MLTCNRTIRKKKKKSLSCLNKPSLSVFEFCFSICINASTHWPHEQRSWRVSVFLLCKWGKVSTWSPHYSHVQFFILDDWSTTVKPVKIIIYICIRQSYSIFFSRLYRPKKQNMCLKNANLKLEIRNNFSVKLFKFLWECLRSYPDIRYSFKIIEVTG